MPASSIARADASISSSGSMVSCITPMRKGTANCRSLTLVFRRGLVRLRRNRADAGLGAAVCDGGLNLRVERLHDLLHLLVDDRLQHALPHRADRACELHVGGPL